MNTETVTIVRIYIREQEHLLKDIVKFLRDDTDAPGVTVLRGVEGFGQNRAEHSNFLVDLSLDLPLVIEFYDEATRAESIIHALLRRFTLPHIMSWTATRHKPD
ncbi:MAG: DUF190 domain-containing protein [Candidatus Methylumidiphilus sp.]